MPCTFPAYPEHYKNAIFYSEMISGLLAEKKIKPMPIKLYPDGLASVPEGMAFMKAGKVLTPNLP